MFTFLARFWMRVSVCVEENGFYRDFRRYDTCALPFYLRSLKFEFKKVYY